MPSLILIGPIAKKILGPPESTYQQFAAALGSTTLNEPGAAAPLALH